MGKKKRKNNNNKTNNNNNSTSGNSNSNPKKRKRSSSSAAPAPSALVSSSSSSLSTSSSSNNRTDKKEKHKKTSTQEKSTRNNEKEIKIKNPLLQIQQEFFRHGNMTQWERDNFFLADDDGDEEDDDDDDVDNDDDKKTSMGDTKTKTNKEKQKKKKKKKEGKKRSMTPERRAELWMEQAEIGEELVNKYSWATPNQRALNILQHFSPLIEIGCGSNAYWANELLSHFNHPTHDSPNDDDNDDDKEKKTVDIIAYDSNVQDGGRIIHAKDNDTKKKKMNRKEKKETATASQEERLVIRKGGPEVLATPEIRNSNRTLFLCYPDEYDDDEEEEEEEELWDNMDHENVTQQKISMAARCLEYYTGEYVIHVGELFLDANIALDQCPWGRSASPEFQSRLATEFHCLLKLELPNWVHVRDALTVWKRSKTCIMVFASNTGGDHDDDDDDDDGEEEEVEYRHIPPNERLPVSIAAPCLAHLLK